MRVQHNILAMNSYRNYSNNVKALGGNLEKLSSGYKINRAGDDAAGLAISEKMRAQIKGLEAAQKNVKDATSFVKTAEGAMQEIQDMLKRMKYLATQSANGTYENDVDRENLQAEVDALVAEIDRIAENANFNGIHMLKGGGAANGSTGTGGTTPNGAAYTPAVANDGIALAAMEIDTANKVKASAAGSVSGVTLTGINFASNAAIGATAATELAKEMTVTFGTGTNSVAVKVTLSGIGSTTTGTAAAAAIQTQLRAAADAAIQAAGTSTKYGVQSTSITVTGADGSLTIKGDIYALKAGSTEGPGSSASSAAVPKDTTVSVDLSKITKNFASGDSIKIGDVTYTFASGTGVAAVAATTITVQLGADKDETLANLAKAIDDQKATTNIGAKIEGGKLVLTTTAPFDSKEDFENAVALNLDGITDADTKAALQEAWDAGVKDAVDKLGGGGGDEYSITMQIGDSASETLTIKIGSMKTDGKMNIKGLDISDPTKANAAIDQVKDAINYVSSVRGQLGAYQNRLDHTLNNLSTMTENIQDAESTIRDTDVAEEMMAYVKNNILVQSAQAMLAQANQVPQGVLQLLG